MSGVRWSLTRAVVAIVGVTLMTVGSVQFATAAQAAVGSVHAPVVGSGSTWSANALQQWIRNVWANYQWKLTYSESGSTQGRNDFANGTSDFGVSEIPYGIANSNEADQRPSRGFAYMPIVAGGTSFMYNLEIAGKKVTNLRLSGDSVAKIFAGVITVWNDPQIVADNPQLALPAVPIVPVVRSDGSGATAQFSIWLRQEHPDVWDAYCAKVGRESINGHCGVTSNYPVVPGSGFVARAGSNGVAGYVAQSQSVGAITFVEYSYALNAGFPVVKLLNSAGYYTEPTAQAVAVGLLQAHINEDENSPDYLTQDLRDVYLNADSRAYPLSSYSYIILPIRNEANFSDDKGLTLAAFGSYFLCEGQQQAETLGYSPLPVNLVEGAQKQIKRVPGGDPAVTGFSARGSCNNPTLDPSDPNGNALAKTAALPPDCDRQGPTQCATGTGGAKTTTTALKDATAATTSTDTTSAATNGAQSAAAATGPSGAAAAAVDSVDGAAKGPTVLAATPQALPVASIGLLSPTVLFAAGLALIAATLLPPWLGRRARRRGNTLPDPAIRKKAAS
ncbi:phosphate ABC transporter substrate-binding protein PstS [uncultured Microbacterium sp.]|uniref:phosphate ABC transporter substrate-binding protein PstS n=1 Tax=uncultured Microbacterium sp. TaxID=191216 RepID=UPI0035CBC5A7